MSDARYGYTIIKELSDAQALPNATTVDSTNMAYVGKGTNYGQVIYVFANTDITIATGQAFSIELESYSSDTAASAIAPFSVDNEGGKVAYGGGTAETNAHIYALHKTIADGELAFSAGDLIAEIPIPEKLLAALGHTYVQLKYTTDADESSEKVDAVLCAAV